MGFMVERRNPGDKRISDEARALHFSTPVIDAHCDTLWRCASRHRDIGRSQSTGHIDLIKLKEGGVKIQVFAAFVHPSQSHRGFFNLAMRMNDALQNALVKYPYHLKLILCKEDFQMGSENGRIGAIFGIEGAHSLEGSIDNLYKFYNKGLRLVTLTWNNPNSFADSSAANPVNSGLSPLGVKLIKEMNNLGVIPDLSHSSADTLKEVIKVSKKPVLVSHSCCKALCDIHRNLTDSQIRMIASNGGVIGVNFFPLFLDNNYLETFTNKNQKRLAAFVTINKKYGSRSSSAEREKRRLKRGMFDELPEVSYKRIVDHIEHIIFVGGEDCVGLGSDFDGIPITPAGMENAACLPRLTHEMLERGWDKNRIKKILGLNMLRLFKEVLP
jgi:membrane dipeptidase